MIQVWHADQGVTLRVGPVAMCLKVALVSSLKEKVPGVTDWEVDPPSLSPSTPEEQYEADVADAGRRR